MNTRQASFTDKIDRTKEILERLEREYSDIDTVNLAVSGGTDSIVAADVMCRYGPEYGFEPDYITHINTGAGVPQSQLAGRVLAHMHDVEFIEQGYRKQKYSLAARVLSSGWPAAYGGHPSELGHGREWANRKDKPMQEVYMQIDGMQIWVSGARILESKKRSGNVPKSGIQEDSRSPRRVWVQPISGWTDAEKREYIIENELPVSEAYQILGYSAECTACAYDDASLLTDLQLLCPELAYAISSLAVWLGQLAVRGEVDVDPKQLCWGWEPEGETQRVKSDSAQEWIGCSAESCSERDIPAWVMELDQNQVIDRNDVEAYWNDGIEAVSEGLM